MQSLNDLKNKIFDKSVNPSPLTPIVALAKELGCLSDLLGRTYEVKDGNGKVIATITQKPMKFCQMNILLEELDLLSKIEKAKMEENKPKAKPRGRKK